jgi:hypothetical protein
MYLVQLLLPLSDNEGRPFAAQLYRRVRDELTDRFGGLTAFTRAPAQGLWQDRPGDTVRDEIVVYEVMVERLDYAWWRSYRTELERSFRQDELVIRAQAVERL